MTTDRRQRPNILFLMTDQQRYDQLGCTNPVLRTPSLDALAGEGVLFTRASTTNPSCVPARAAILTGRYPSQIGVPHNTGVCLPPHERTFMSMLREVGYHTAVVGKQHFNGSRVERGYDYEDIIDSHSPARVIDPEALRGTRQDNSYQRFLYDSGFRGASELVEPVDDVVNRWKAEPRFHVDHYVGCRGAEWLRERRPTDRPWFFCLSFLGPHGPVDCHGMPQEDLYPLDAIDLPATGLETLYAKPAHYRRTGTTGGRPKFDRLSEDHVRRIRRAWYANVSLIDEQVGSVLTALRETGQYDNTLIVFTTDHGDFGCDLNLVDKGQYLLDVLMHIPLIVKPPAGGAGGKRESSLVSSIDLPATFLAAAGAEVPANMRSRDLSPYWASAADLDDRESAYLEANQLRGLRTREWKLIHYQGQDEGELYDLQADPAEANNLWDSPGHQPIKAELTRQLLDRVIDLGENSHLPWMPGSRPPDSARPAAGRGG